MPILAVGISHHEAPIELRERLAIPSERLEEAVDRLGEYVPEGVILSTCNRTEIYAAVGHQASGLRVLTRFLADLSQLDEASLLQHLRSHWQESAIRHLFTVSAGLDSMMLGEGQILAQVRQAYELAARRRPLGAVLGRLFDRALLVGKRARSETGIARSAVSISQAAVELATEAVGPLRGCTVLVLGTGKMGELTAGALRNRGIGRVLLMNRTAARADDLMSRLGGEAWPIERLGEALQVADIAISSTTSSGPVVTAEAVRPLLAKRGARPLVLVDIAVPRDIEPATGELPGVHLYNVDDLEGHCAASLVQRRREAEKVAEIVEEELQRFLRWWETREVAPTIGALVQKAERIRQEELKKAMARLGPLSEREASAVNALTLAIVNKMLHAPISRLKDSTADLDGNHYLTAVRELFDLAPVELAGER